MSDFHSDRLGSNPCIRIMPKFRKTSTQPKRKPKKHNPVVEKVYPDFIQKFINDVESQTPFKIRIDQCGTENLYNVSVLEKRKKVYHCVWYVGFVDNQNYLNMFWTSEFYKNWKLNGI